MSQLANSLALNFGAPGRWRERFLGGHSSISQCRVREPVEDLAGVVRANARWRRTARFGYIVLLIMLPLLIVALAGILGPMRTADDRGRKTVPPTVAFSNSD